MQAQQPRCRLRVFQNPLIERYQGLPLQRQGRLVVGFELDIDRQLAAQCQGEGVKIDRLRKKSCLFHGANERLSLADRTLHFPHETGDIDFYSSKFTLKR